MKPLSRSFYARSTLDVARALIGRTLVHESDEGTVAGRIVEVEAYGGAEDPASHGYRGQTARNTTMFGPPGHLYVYFTYGMHYCSNIVCERDGKPGAVLLRAVEPTEGLDLMSERREVREPKMLARGPARLCQAFGIGREFDGTDLVDGPVCVEGRQKLKAEVLESPRIGIKTGLELSWRIYEPGTWAS